MSGHFQEFEDEYLETMYGYYEHDPDALVRTGELANALKNRDFTEKDNDFIRNPK